MRENKESNLITNIEELILDKYKLKRNIATHELEYNGAAITDTDLNTIIVNCKRHFKRATTQTVGEILYSHFIPHYNPFKDFFDVPPKDYLPVGNIKKLIESIETDTPGAEIWITKWLAGLVRSAYYGIHSPLYLILCGGQNSGKTEFFRRLLPDVLQCYYAECKFDRGKDDDRLMARKLIILDDEMAGKTKSEEAQLKARTSMQGVTLRLPYGKVDITLNRIAMLCGTTNETQVLSDPTGNRRLLPINVLSINHILYNSINKADLLHECFNLLKSGYIPDLTKDEIALLNASTENFEVTCPIEEAIQMLYKHIEPGQTKGILNLTTTHIMNGINGNTGGQFITTRKVNAVMKKLGFDNPKTTVNGLSGRYYTVAMAA